ncbi:tRNA 2-thiouridine(34) synthase MnmA [Marinilabilia salmonicolor]|jgi:tRNA-specific 2-thiouridylase|uniref:tRNA-specific 2-thiouridylase MnmA n=1 Tax=Marinilabilia salmonicolor TaxID=989 RepID=A0A368V0D0_9BACT|nr:tRNA 2-thiouridine(34) synthase MnmA [Marinilabilia salmonicolor]RCW34572.1 tRNA (5-methylaminomethyl-2-thiouridylate)-methyltransferase [Marinilabilia salmonicolor]
MTNQKKRVVVGLSGGVDSSVAARVLQEQGYEVIGLFMKNWHDTTGVLESDCPWLDDKFDAEAVARKLNIPFHFVDLSTEYRARVVDYMFSEYEKGRTPNPDVLCNREIKFDVFMDKAFELGADYVATGHYCRKETIQTENGEVHRLLAGADGNKDQSYFLCQLSQKQLAKALFPIGEMVKPEVRKVAGDLKLVTAHKKDSQGICFVGKVDLPVFLQQKLEAKKGRVFLIPPDSELFQRDWSKAGPEADTAVLEELSASYSFHPRYGQRIGEHNGAHFYTIGQRKGLDIGGFAEPLFVIGIDVEFNQVFVGMGKEHPGLFRRVLKINNEEIHWVRPDLTLKDDESRRLKVRIRYRQPLQDGVLIKRGEGMFIVFDEPQRGITAGQFAAWYENDELTGSGVIS